MLLMNLQQDIRVHLSSSLQLQTATDAYLIEQNRTLALIKSSIRHYFTYKARLTIIFSKCCRHIQSVVGGVTRNPLEAARAACQNVHIFNDHLTTISNFHFIMTVWSCTVPDHNGYLIHIIHPDYKLPQFKVIANCSLWPVTQPESFLVGQ